MDRNKAIEIVRSHYPANKQMLNEALETLVPELKESEDERTRKKLLGFIENWKNPNNVGRLDDYPMFTKNEEQCNKYIAWLEKQGEKSQDKPANNAEKVEPKFHKDDWVVIKK